jgi:hypothetical protein
MVNPRRAAGGIFLSYRRDDTKAYAGRLSDQLATRFGAGRIFMDVDGIQPGSNYIETIRARVDSCDVLLALIGPAWLTAADSEGRRRLDQADDLVRIEIATALERNRHVIPVLVEGARMPPAAELPEPLAALASLQALHLDHIGFRHQIANLTEVLEPLLAAPAQAQAAWKTKGPLWLAAVVIVAAASLLVMWLRPFNGTLT